MNEQNIRILVVDDEQDLCDILRYNLETEGWQVDTANSAEEALELLTATGTHAGEKPQHYSLMLLDVMMGGMSGFSLAKKMRRKVSPALATDLDRAIAATPKLRDLPIIFLTARDTENDTVTGFSLGADDYISKPFSIREVIARIRAVLRRTCLPTEQNTSQENTLSYEGLVVNLDRKSATIDGKEVSFTKTEFELLCLLLEHRGHVFSRQELIDRVWPSDVLVLDRTVDVNITRLRKKIGSYASCLVTRLGYGYYFNV